MPQDVKLDENLDLKKDFPFPSFNDWKKQVEKDLKGEQFEKKLTTKTYEEITLQPIYTSKDIKELPQINNFPGYQHFIRRNDASGYHKRE